MLFPVIRWAVGALVGWEREGDDFIDAVAKANDCALGAFNDHVTGSGVGAVTAIGAVPDVDDLRSAVSEVSETAAEFAAPVEVVAGRGLDIRHDETAKDEAGEESERETFFHEDVSSYSNR